MKIALLTDGIPPYVVGGMQTHSAVIANQLVKNNNKVDLFHFVTENSQIPTNDEVNDIFFLKTKYQFNNVYCCKFPSSIKFPGHYLFNSLRYSNWIFRIAQNQINDYDFIYAKGFSAWKLLSKINKSNSSVKVGINFHGFEMYQYAPTLKIKLQHYMLRPFVKKICKKADVVFSYGGKISDIISGLGIPKNRIIEIPSLIDRSWINVNFKKIQTTVRVLFVGRNERRKGIYELNKAIKLLDNKNINNDLEFHFLGNISEADKIGTEKIKIVYHGVVIEVFQKQKIYDSCDILICPSFSEGMPNVILEAMSRGLAIIATDVGAISEMVCPKNGVLLKDNSPEIISTSILKITSDKSILNKLKLNSISKVEEKFNTEIVFQKLLKTIKMTPS